MINKEKKFGLKLIGVNLLFESVSENVIPHKWKLICFMIVLALKVLFFPSLLTTFSQPFNICF